MDEYSCVRCLFCATGKEEAVVRAIHDRGLGRAIFPKRVKSIRQGHSWIDTMVPLLPGYVFVYGDQISASQRAELHEVHHVIRPLCYGSSDQDILVGRDLEFADWLWNLDGRVGAMKALQVGDKIEITDGVFKQLHGRITRMDRRRKTIHVELDTQGALRSIWLTYDIVEKLESQS